MIEPTFNPQVFAVISLEKLKEHPEITWEWFYLKGCRII